MFQQETKETFAYFAYFAYFVIYILRGSTLLGKKIQLLTKFCSISSPYIFLGCGSLYIPRLRPLGPPGLLDNVLHALRALRPCDPRINAMMGWCIGDVLFLRCFFFVF